MNVKINKVATNVLVISMSIANIIHYGSVSIVMASIENIITKKKTLVLK